LRGAQAEVRRMQTEPRLLRAGQNMTFTHAEGFQVIGIGARTTNALEMSGKGIIPELWGRAFGAGIFDKIPGRLDRDIIALYSDYASDEHGEYSFLIGTRVPPHTPVPEGMVGKAVPAGKYAVFTSERGPVSKVVIDTWKRIWAQPRSSDYARSYRADYEVYGAQAVNPGSAQIDIYIGVL
jgi:predicted transcriptional regulator YdeE